MASQYESERVVKIWKQKCLNGLQMVQFECPRHWRPPVSSNFQVVQMQNYLKSVSNSSRNLDCQGGIAWAVARISGDGGRAWTRRATTLCHLSALNLMHCNEGKRRSQKNLSGVRIPPLWGHAQMTSAQFSGFFYLPPLVSNLEPSIGVAKRVPPRFGEFCYCCCLPLLPQLAYIILATTYQGFVRSLCTRCAI